MQNLREIQEFCPKSCNPRPTFNVIMNLMLYKTGGNANPPIEILSNDKYNESIVSMLSLSGIAVSLI